ncbi:MAG TPA: cytochrome c [Solirubrobacteraceae bacterium]|jgi:mono/diheme cytochrome c family protein|nr:cytochrome c [Solirubrobacteraceae bacterium]
MVGVIIIAVVFTALAVGIGYGATRGAFKGVAAALLTTNRSGSRLLNTSLVVVYLGVGICVPLLFIIGNRDKSDAQVGGVKLTAAAQVGRELFGEHCAVCHTLAADNAVGKTGPNLDTLKPTKSLILHTLANGCLQTLVGKDYNTICLGYGTMPADILQGRQAQDVAAFVSSVAGHA